MTIEPQTYMICDMKHILVVGRKFSSLTNYLEEHDYQYTYFLDSRLPKKAYEVQDNNIEVDFSNKNNIIEALLKLKTPVDGVMTMYENYVIIVAWITKRLGLPGLPMDSAEACTDKNLMRQRFSTVPTRISPDFMLIKHKQDIIDFSSNHSFPLIIKPANLVKSLLVTKSNNIDELMANYAKSIDLIEAVYKKHAPDRTPRLLIEEFLDGSIHSVDALVDSDGTPLILEQIVDYQTGYDIGYDDNFHYSRILPSKLSPVNQQKLRECADIGIRALGMKNSPAHVEIIMTKNGPRLVEIGARNGGYRERMHSIANGFDLIKATIDIATGLKPTIKAARNDSIAVLELFPKTKGNFIQICYESELHRLASTYYVSIKALPGDIIGKSSDGYKATVIIILHNTDKKQFDSDLDFVNKKVSVVVEPGSR